MDFSPQYLKFTFWLPKISNSHSSSLFIPFSTTTIDQNQIKEYMQSEKEIFVKMTFSWFNGWNSFFIHQFWNFHCFCLYISLKKLEYLKIRIIKLFHPINQEKVIFIEYEKLYFSVQNQPYFKLKNLGTYFSIFHNFRNWATFSHHFWIIQMILQPLVTNSIIAMLKIKSALCGETPCIM